MSSILIVGFRNTVYSRSNHCVVGNYSRKSRRTPTSLSAWLPRHIDKQASISVHIFPANETPHPGFQPSNYCLARAHEIIEAVVRHHHNAR